MAITLKYNCNTLMCVHNIRTSLSCRPVHDIYYTVYKIQRGQRRIKINNIHVFYTLAKNSYSQYNPRSPTNNFFFFFIYLHFSWSEPNSLCKSFFPTTKKRKEKFLRQSAKPEDCSFFSFIADLGPRPSNYLVLGYTSL